VSLSIQPNQKFISRLTRLIQGGLLVFLALSLYASLHTGLADNGDFNRVMTWYTSGPADMAENWPAVNTPEYHQRFFWYFIPEWKLDFPLKGIFSSVELIWLPGVLLNWLTYSHTVLSLIVIGLVPRLISLAILWLAFLWINHSERSWRGLVLTLTLGIPLAFLLGSGAYTVYFNSFYQETGSYIFLFLFLASLVFAWRHENAMWPRFLALAALFCLLTAKVSNIYWVIPGILLVVPWRNVSARPKAYIPLYICCAAVLILAVILSPNRPDIRKGQTFQSLFNGALIFSSQPTKRLDELGLKGARRCISQYAAQPVGQGCVEQFGDKVSFLSTVQVILHEPIILFRIIRFSAKNMQTTNLELGKTASGGPRLTELQTALTSGWALLKEALFPRGIGLLATLAGFTVLFSVSLWRARSFQRELALFGLLATLACLVDMNVQVLGDGRADILKHMFLANVLFDIALIAAFNLGVIYLAEWLEHRWTAKARREKV
jgi:hypothetical protein